MVGYGALVTCVIAATLITVSRNKEVRAAMFSNVHVAWALFYGSQRTPTQAGVVDEMLNEMYRYGAAKASVDTEHRSRWCWNSIAGIDRIRQHPLRYLAFCGERVLNAMFPSFFRQGVSLRYKVFDRAMSVFLVVGAVLSLVATRKTGSLIPSLVFTSFCIYLLIGFFQSEWDVRVQLSPHVLLIPVASFGWVWASRHARARRSITNAALPHDSPT